ncbi:HAD domain-containing protein [Homoserinimonas sp. A447]
MSLTKPFLVDPPRPGVDHVEGLVVCDFDGVLNSLSPDRNFDTLPTVLGSSGRDLPINLISSEILDTLQSALRPGIKLAWLTSWGFRISRLEELFAGRFSGGFVVSERPAGMYVSADWKLHAFEKLVAQWPDAKTAWIEDDQIPMAVRYSSLSQSHPEALLIAPDPEIGLSQRDAERVVLHLN